MAVIPIPLLRSRVTIQVGEGEFEAELPLGELEDLQAICGLGPEKIIERLQNGEWWVGEIRHTIRLGLQGAGMDPHKAQAIVDRNVRPPYLQFYAPIALTLVFAAVSGLPHDPVGEPEAATETTEDFETTEMNAVSGASQSSTE